MSSTDEQIQVTTAPDASKSEQPELPPQVEVQLAPLKALLAYTNPFGSDEERQLVLRALHHETGGSDEGLALADSWLSKGDAHPGGTVLRDTWQALADSTEDPVTIDALCEIVTDYGFDVVEIYSQIETDTTDSDVRTADTSPAPSTLLDKYSLKGKREQLLRDAVKQAFALEPLALMGQDTVIFSPPNTGKTLITLHLVADAISKGNIDPAKLYYFNADDSHAGLLEKLEHSDEYGYHTIAEGHQGFSTGEFLKILDELTADNQADDVIIILDTGKKFFDPMSKREGRTFGKHSRLFVMKGNTIIVLSHTNKYRDSEGKPIYAGTSDLVEDFDSAYIMYEAGINADTETKSILLENIKNRGCVARQASYRYSIAENLSYREILESVEPLDDTELAALQQSEEYKSDAELIEIVIACIQDGFNSKMKLASAAAERSDMSKRAILRLIEKYAGTDPARHKWTYTVQDRGAKVFSILSPDSAVSDPAGKT